jgi:ubiquinone/menaquinone biosynthesis C-methylase UbiE
VMRNESRFLRQKERIRQRLLKYTRRAFRMLPEMDRPRILDIGCGSGIPTLELARLSNGKIIGLDIDQDLLAELVRRAEKAGLSSRVKAVKASLVDMKFPAESFDVIWSEGSIWVVGFKRGLEEWKRILTPGGFLAVHDEQGDIPKKLKQISACGYELVGWFTVDKDAWREEYYAPLKTLIEKTASRRFTRPKVLEVLRVAQREIEWFKENPDRSSSVFFVMKKTCSP